MFSFLNPFFHFHETPSQIVDRLIQFPSVNSQFRKFFLSDPFSAKCAPNDSPAMLKNSRVKKKKKKEVGYLRWKDANDKRDAILNEIFYTMFLQRKISG